MSKCRFLIFHSKRSYLERRFLIVRATFRVDQWSPPPVRKTYPRSFRRAYDRRTSSPRGSHPEVCRWWGRGRRLRVGLRPTPGRLRGTALGTLRSLCEELAGRLGRDGLRKRGRDNPMRGTGARTRSSRPARPYKRGPKT